MKLLVTYPETSNDGFNYIYDRITKRLQQKYPELSIERYDSTELIHNILVYSYGGGSCYPIVNLDNNKCSILSFADHTGVHLYAGHGFDHLKIVEIFGCMRWDDEVHTPEEISAKHNISYRAFQRPAAFGDAHEYSEKNRIPYDPTKRIRKAVYAGSQLPERINIFEYLRKHPLFHIHGGYIPRYDYYNMMNEYAMFVSLNGVGEVTDKDYDVMRMGSVLLRSDLKTTLYKPLIPDFHFLKGSVASPRAAAYYNPYTFKEIAEQFIDTVEKTMYDDDLLTEIAINGHNYYLENCQYDILVDRFIDMFDPEILR